MLSEPDLQLVHALQETPRASWTQIGDVLGVERRSLARRYAQLRADGDVTVMATPGPALLSTMQFGIIRLQSAPGQGRDVATALASWPHVTTVRIADGTFDIYAMMVHVDHRRLISDSQRMIATIPSVRRSEVHTVFRTIDAGRAGRLDSLSLAERAALQSLSPPVASSTTLSGLIDSDIDLLDLLTEDGRMDSAELARRTGREPSTISRRLGKLQTNRYLDFVTIVPDRNSSFPVHALQWCSVAPDELPTLEQRLVSTSWVESATVLSGTHNLCLAGHVHSTAQVPALRAQATDLAESMRVHEVQLVSQAVKVHTRWVRDDGRWSERVDSPFSHLAELFS